MNYLTSTPKQLIESIRDMAGLSDTEIGESIGLAQSTVGRLRAGRLVDTSSANWRALIQLHKKVAHLLTKGRREMTSDGPTHPKKA